LASRGGIARCGSASLDGAGTAFVGRRSATRGAAVGFGFGAVFGTSIAATAVGTISAAAFGDSAATEVGFASGGGARTAFDSPEAPGAAAVRLRADGGTFAAEVVAGPSAAGGT
jgi:hypothetical protein